MKKAFSLLELIFAIVLIGIIISFAIPKYLNTKNTALATTIKRDVITTITSVQSYYLLNQGIDDINEVISLNTKNWTVDKLNISFKECLELKIVKNDSEAFIDLKISNEESSICEAIKEQGLSSKKFDLM